MPKGQVLTNFVVPLVRDPGLNATPYGYSRRVIQEDLRDSFSLHKRCCGDGEQESLKSGESWFNPHFRSLGSFGSCKSLHCAEGRIAARSLISPASWQGAGIIKMAWFYNLQLFLAPVTAPRASDLQ